MSYRTRKYYSPGGETFPRPSAYETFDEAKFLAPAEFLALGFFASEVTRT
jgi:hypothetical protein